MTCASAGISAASLSFVLLALGGCLPQLLPEQLPAPLTYDFGPLPDALARPLPEWVRLEGVTAPIWLEGLDIHYRRLDEQPGALRRYARSQWIAPLPELFAERLGYRLAHAVPKAPGSRGPPLALSLELITFEQVFVAPQEAYAVARARAWLWDDEGRRLQREFERRQPTAPSVEGATGGLPRVADDLIDAVHDWLAEMTSALD